MAIDFLKYDLYRKYETSNGVDYTPLDEYQCVVVDKIPSSDCGDITFNAYLNSFIGLGVETSNKIKLANVIENFNDFYSVDSKQYLDIEGKKGTYYYTGKYNNLEDFYFTIKSGLTDLSNLFNACIIDEVNILKDFDTSSVTTMSKMFYETDELKKVNLNKLNTSNVEDFSSMFYDSSVRTVECGDWDTSKAKKVSYMFGYCSYLTYINASNWDFSNVEEKNNMFAGYYDRQLNHIKCKRNFRQWCLDNQDEINLPDNMKEGGDGLWEIVDPNNYITATFSIDEDNTEAKLFYDVNLIEYTSLLPNNEIAISKLDKDTNTYTFEKQGLYDIRYIPRINKNDLTYFFSNCKNIESIDLSHFDGTNINIIESFFEGCTNLKTINFGNFDTSNITSFVRLFDACSSLTSIDLSGFNTSNIIDFSSMFSYCSSIETLNLYNFNTSKATSMASMFSNCTNLSSLNISNFNTSNVTELDSMFYNCNNLKTLTLTNFDTSKVTSMASMFSNCKSLKKLDLSTFTLDVNDNLNFLFEGCSSLESLDVSKFEIPSKLMRYSSMFNGCDKLIYIKCKQSFKDWCLKNKYSIKLPDSMSEGGSGVWEIV